MAELGRLESAYRNLPSFLQSVVFSAWGVRSRHLRFGGEFSALLPSLERSDFDDSDAIHRRQADAFRRMLQHATASVPYYRKHIDVYRPLERHDLFEQLAALPVVAKATVKEATDAFLSERVDPRRRVTMPTSGTTGTPLVVHQTRYALRFQWAIWWRHKARFGIRLGDPFLSFGARVPVLGDRMSVPWRENIAIRQTYLVSSLLTGNALDRAVDMLRRRQFTYYTGYPSAMYVLARAVLDRGVVLERTPRMIFTGSDALTPGFRDVIENAFRAKVSDNFGSAEMCGNLSQCPLGRYHVDHELGIVEFLPVEHSDDLSLRRVVCTGLVNEAMPLIRYDIGDYVRTDGTPCSCGRSSPSVISVCGREEDFIRTTDGRLVTGLNQVLEWVPDLIQAQVRQDDLAVIDVLLVTHRPMTEEQRHVLTRELRKRVGETMAIRIRRVDEIPRTANGKFRAVVSTVKQPD